MFLVQSVKYFSTCISKCYSDGLILFSEMSDYDLNSHSLQVQLFDFIFCTQ
uniref:Uncharacterized protein n=1 Tax=Arundo donax TaxID=35708 RepID=A0A0A9GYW0_ARUDO